jgi:small subunit ribosomal protein S9
MEGVNTTGRRKSAIARIYVYDGKGQIIVNNREYKEYFTTQHLHHIVEQPLALTEVTGRYDIKANLNGGGVTGQAEALRLAISRALILIDPEKKPLLKSSGLLTRDPREVERKKPGRPKARKRFQFSKR